jgi:uncharacterized protein (TIGR02145 family)
MNYKKIFNVVGVVAVAVVFSIGCNKPEDPPEDPYIPPEKPSIPAPVKTDFTDSRDGKTYKKVTIGTQTWMAENLKYNAEGSVCYGEGGESFSDLHGGKDSSGNWEGKYKTLSESEVQANCAKYGRLYSQNTVLTACPAGWHLPTGAEWTTLINYTDSTCNNYGGCWEINALRSKSGWYILYHDEVDDGARLFDLSEDNPFDGEYTIDAFGFSALPGGRGGCQDEYDDITRCYFENVGTNVYFWSATMDVLSEYYIMWYQRGDTFFQEWGGGLGASIRCVQD